MQYAGSSACKVAAIKYSRPLQIGVMPAAPITVQSAVTCAKVRCRLPNWSAHSQRRSNVRCLPESRSAKQKKVIAEFQVMHSFRKCDATCAILRSQSFFNAWEADEDLAAKPQRGGVMMHQAESKGPRVGPQINDRSGCRVDHEITSGIELTGVIKWFDVSKGYGFIVPDNGTSDIFLHGTCLRR